MSDVIKLVQGDTLPSITITLTDEVTGAAFDLSGGGTSIAIKFRAVNATTVLATIVGSVVDGPNGVFEFDFTPSVLLGIDPGQYEGEIKVTTAAGLQTVFEPIKFRVRAKF
jgi:hypothetical protein